MTRSERVGIPKPCHHGSPAVRQCVRCNRERATAWNKANQARRREITIRHDLRKDGVPEEELDLAVELMRTRTACEICGDSQRLCVDHDHRLKLVRGILCDSCNRMVGGIENDSPYAPGKNNPRRASLQAYLDTWQTRRFVDGAA